MRDTASGPTVGIYGFFGMGNIGNEGSLAAFLEGLRRHRPDATVRAFVAAPGPVVAEHHVASVRMMWHRGSTTTRPQVERARKAGGRLVDVPRTFWLMRDVDVLVVPGTGVLETKLMAGPWGMPLWLLLAAAACRVRGRPVALVSIGAEPAEHPLTRLFFTATTRLATWTSVRDEASREVLESWGARRPVRVTPDLAFALRVPDLPVVRPGHVVVGVMSYAGDPLAPPRDPAVPLYAARMTDVVERLVTGGGTVTLVVGDVADLGLAREIRDAVVRRRPLEGGSVTVSRGETLQELMLEMGEAEVAVVSRFHNLVCALKVGTPSVSLSYAGKNARLLEELGLPGFDQSIEDFDVDRLLLDLDRARASRSSLEVSLKEAGRRYAEELDTQMRDLVDEVIGRAGRPPGPRTPPVPRRRAGNRPRRR